MISLNKINRHYTVGDEKVHALNDVNFDVKAGEYIAIMGPSGSGKSTLLNMIGLLDKPNSGKYNLDGREVTGLRDNQISEVRGNKIGFIFQFFHLIPRMSASQNIELPMILSGVSPKLRKERVKEAIELFGLAKRANHRPSQLSGGQRQRVAIARATIMGPSILLADEPTGNLDQSSGYEIMEILEGLNRRGITLIMVTHDKDLGQRASRHISMVDGHIESDNQTISNAIN
jgi:putative ABC transport system ATP-binding protein